LPHAKVKLFRSLFRGREDVYARRFESQKTGRTGYSPACANEWVSGLCEKPRIKCRDCQHRQFLPITDEVICQHLAGKDRDGRDFVMGVYPMLLDETCFFLAADFDKADWRDDVMAFLETCQRLKLPAALERSRGGNGGHIWLFFDAAIPSRLARDLGSHILTETMERRPDIGLDSYDRFFPNQDTLPQAGFGNLIALPLQKQPRVRGNSVFLDNNFAPYADQWVFLSSIRRISRRSAEDVVCRAERQRRIVGVHLALPDEEENAAPWTARRSRRRAVTPIAGELPDSLKLVLEDDIYIAKETLLPSLRNRLVRLAAFQNPEFYKAQAMRLPTYDKPRIITCAYDHPHHIALPRGCLDDLQQLLRDLKVKPIIQDQRYTGELMDFEFHGQLHPEQMAAANAMIAHDTGVLSAATAFGKTVIAAWLIARRRVNTLVVVHRKQLLEQWIERLSEFLALPPKEIGRIGAGRKKPTGQLDVATVQSLVRNGVVDDRVREYGHLVVDECHHLSARSFELAARHATAKFVTGLTATPIRKDGHHPIIFMQCGPVRYRVDAKQQADARPFEHNVIVRPTAFFPKELDEPDARRQFHELYDQLTVNDARNQVICADVVQAVKEGRSPVVLTERRAHLDRLEKQLSPKVRHLVVLRGGLSGQELAAISARLAAIPEHEERVLLATGRYIGEGFDDARLDSLFLTLPVSWRGTIAQYAGRLHRRYESKREVRVYDYADLNVPMLAKMFDRRCKGYEAVGYKVLLPASAMPGWPADVLLPVDPNWKEDFAASVRRLARDGVDNPLADLFVHVTRTVDSDAEGVNRARSASEAFLYRRLETLPETMGRFRLNAQLPIVFDGWGQMEVDLLCDDARLVVELDGAQHLSDADAYRRDRRKDMLLQEHGYLVLRFLAEDVGRRLDTILDAILRTLAHQQAIS
jgi:superfamily II DNA or RNA helicase/very-short-patch-repair endonuclease